VRRINAEFWQKKLKKYSTYFTVHEQKPGTRHVWFACAIIVNPKAGFTRRELIAFLEKKGVETRPIMAGNIADQPAMKQAQYRRCGTLPNSRLLMIMHSSSAITRASKKRNAKRLSPISTNLCRGDNIPLVCKDNVPCTSTGGLGQNQATN